MVIMLQNVIIAGAKYSDMPENTNETRIVDILTKLGVMRGYEDGTFKPSQAITRAEFSTLIYQSLGFVDKGSGGAASSAASDGFNWSKIFLGDDSSDFTIMYPPSQEETGSEDAPSFSGLWSDVNEEHWAYPYLKGMKDFGFIAGYTDESFKPENTVTCDEAVKIILTICGYEAYADSLGGYPEGYRKLASDNKLYTGMTATGSKAMSRMDAATLIYNAFTLEIADPLYTDRNSSEDKNFLNDIMGVYTLEGTIVSTDTASIYGKEVCDENMAKIGETSFLFDTDESYIRDYIGRDVRAFLRENENDEYVLLAFETTAKDDVTVIDNDTIDSFKDNTFTYSITDGGTKTKSVKIRNGSAVIYNGKYLQGYSSDTFSDMDNGSVTVIKKRSLDFDIVFVEEFRSGYTDSVNAKSMQVIDLLNKSGSAVIHFDKNDDNEEIIYSLFRANGEELDFESLGEGAINYYCSGNYLKMYYSTEKVTGKINQSYTEDGKTYITVGSKKYAVSKSYASYAGQISKTGTEINAILDKYGEIVWITDSASYDGYAYMIKHLFNEDDGVAMITYYDIDSQTVERNVKTDVTVKVQDKDGTTKKVGADGLDAYLDDYDGVLKIVKNDDGVISRIELPISSDNDKSGELRLMLESSDQSTASNYKDKLEYTSGARCFAGKAYMNAYTKIINVPQDREKYDYYKNQSYNEVKTGKYLFKMYNFDPDSVYAKIGIIYTESTIDSSKSIFNKGGLVARRVEAVNDEGERGVQLTIYHANYWGGKQTLTTESFFSPYGENGLTAFDEALDACNEPKKLKIEPGDFAFIAVDSVDNSVMTARVLYDKDGVNPAWCGAEPGADVTYCPEGHEHTTKILGSIPGSTGFVSATGNKTNPIGYTGGSISGYARVPGSSNCWSMYSVGYVYSIKEGLWQLTTENVIENFSGVPDRENYSYTWWDPTFFAVAVNKVHKTRDGYELEKGVLGDVITYEQAGNKASRCLFNTGGGTLMAIYIFEDE